MKFAACTVATPEYPILKMASLQMAHYYGIPTVGIGISADANTFDAQYGWEKTDERFVCKTIWNECH